jgi:hypothetical protein
MRIRLYAPLRSNAVKISAWANLSCNSKMFGSGYQFLIVMLLSFLKSTHSRNFLPFLGTNMTEYLASDLLSLIKPLSMFTLI